MPEVNGERGAGLAKVAGKYAGQARVAVRNVRRDAMDTLKAMEKDGEIGQDAHRGLSDQTQKATDEAIKKIDAALAEKEKEIMQV